MSEPFEPPEPIERLQAIASALSIGGLQRHIFICAPQSNPRCCTYEEGKQAWQQLKRATKALELASPPPGWRGNPSQSPGSYKVGDGTVLRSKVDCLRICEQGPIAVVYPDGTWYHSVSGEVLDQIINQHLVRGRVVEEYAFALDPLR